MPTNEEHQISQYNYSLPDEKIAHYPLAQRDMSKLLVYKAGKITDAQFCDCAEFVPEGALMIFNNTRVIHARIVMHKSTGAQIEIFCLEPLAPTNYEENFAAQNTCEWQCIVGNAKKWKDEILCLDCEIQGKFVQFSAKKLAVNDTGFHIRFSWSAPISFSEVLETIGKIPIPPYLHRNSEESDAQQYQTTYAKHEGSVAAPTAGLHFTPAVFEKLRKKHIRTAEVTLHVGAGTFKPVKAELYTNHTMHHEYCIVQRSLVETIAAHAGARVAVGTTSVRTMESVYWLGVKLCQNPETSIEELTQWEAYSLPQNVSLQESMTALLEYCTAHKVNELRFFTQIMIVPTYTFRVINALFTNFHQPQSTLLLLISAFVGERWKEIYNHALAHEYRFLSYGDSSLLFSDY
ncbi:MAG: S-adenosylmethionine:tRNA ribosyltransferase-isomerase [Bacteroidales bacterium]|jgi:S-adenosylmethionine:tRNA ribosyltransferase-isomerase|nr:S-adenosylmethionine:tRNA ribosyltransferase-isomerase [Bacteroidales bacterium]